MPLLRLADEVAMPISVSTVVPIVGVTRNAHLPADLPATARTACRLKTSFVAVRLALDSETLALLSAEFQVPIGSPADTTAAPNALSFASSGGATKPRLTVAAPKALSFANSDGASGSGA